MSASDQTRHLALMMQQGINDAKRWDWGPFFLVRAQYPAGTAWSLNLQIGGFGLNVGMWSQCRQLY